jgi:hypothetical protein
MTQDAEGLKACPHCRWVPDLITVDGLDSSTTFVYCARCRARGGHVTWLGDKAAAESEAIAAWNTRAPSPVSALVEAVERLERELRRIRNNDKQPAKYMIEEMHEWAVTALTLYRSGK